MAGTEHGGRHERRRFITRQHVEDAAASGQPVRAQGRDVVTDEAAQRAEDLGVRIERDQAPATVSGSTAKATASTATSKPAPHGASDAVLRRAVRAAVVAELGTETPGLDLVIDRVLKSRSR